MKKFLQAIAGSALLALLMLFALSAHAATSTFKVYVDDNEYSVTALSSTNYYVTDEITLSTNSTFYIKRTIGTTSYYWGNYSSSDNSISKCDTRYTTSSRQTTLDAAGNIRWTGDAGKYRVFFYSTGTGSAYVYITKLTAPTFSILSGLAVLKDATVRIATTATEAKVQYSTNGGVSWTSPGSSYSYTIKDNVTIQARSVWITSAKDTIKSDVASATYTIATYYVKCNTTRTPSEDRWTGSDVYAYFCSEDGTVTSGTAEWPGQKGYLLNDYYITFGFCADNIPEKVIFNTGKDKETDKGQTYDLTYVNKKTYNIGGVSSGFEVNKYFEVYSGNLDYDKGLAIEVLSDNFDPIKLTYDDGMWSGKFKVKSLADDGNVYFKIKVSGYDDVTYYANSGAESPYNSVYYIYQNKDESFYQGGLNTDFEYTFYLNYDYKCWIEENRNFVTYVNLPYSEEDFEDFDGNTTPKYFIAGSRMGMWYPQPEWELIKQSDGTYKVDGGRFLFQGRIYVVKVDDYYDYYEKSNWTYLTNPNAKIDANNSSVDLTAQTVSSFSDCVLVNFNAATEDTDDARLNAVVNDNGVWIDKITYKPNTEETESTAETGTLTFDVSKLDDNSQRLFSLVGENIVHKDYPGNASILKTLREASGWQEAWIQYDANGRPYYDYYGNYLYHTAYTRDIFAKNKVKFQLDLNGSDFDYTSDNLIFTEYSKLSDLDTDPYLDFYKYFVGAKDIKNDTEVEIADTDYAFKISTKISGTAHDTAAESANWQCFVARDVWVKGLFKIWTGWGGTTLYDATENLSDSTDALWDNLNYGPYGTTANMVTPITDITAGKDSEQTVTLCSVDDSSATCFNTPGGALTFYNRIVLLYNNKADAAHNIYVMFIQEKETPVIKAFLSGEDNNNNKPSYTWKLQNTDKSSDKVSGYTVTRYRVTSEGNVNPIKVEDVSYAEGSYVSATDLSSDQKLFTEDTTINPGTYFYNIKVTFASGKVLETNSNQITVYGKGAYPEVHVTQLVALNKSGYAYFAEKGIISDEMDEAYSYYLTYPADPDNSDFYLVCATLKDTDYSNSVTDEDGNTETKTVQYEQVEMLQVSADYAEALLADPSLYVWEAKFLVTALDYSECERWNGWRDNFGYPYKNLSVYLEEEPDGERTTDEYSGEFNTLLDTEWDPAVEADDDGIYYADNPLIPVYSLSGETKKCVGRIVDRDGLLCPGTMKASIKYQEILPAAPRRSISNRINSLKESVLSDAIHFTPSFGKPYNLKGTYHHRETALTTDKIKNSPLRNAVKEAADSYSITLADDYKVYYKVQATSSVNNDITVLVPEEYLTFNRHLDLNVNFSRPNNLSEDICNLYDNIYYTMNIDPVEKESEEWEKFNGFDPSNEALRHDGIRYYEDLSSTSSALEPYTLTITDVHPGKGIYSSLQITNTQLINETDTIDATFGDYDSKSYAVADKDHPLSIPNTPDLSAEQEITVGLGWNPADPKNLAAGNKWFLYAYKPFAYPTLNVVSDSESDESKMTKTDLYLLEITDEGSNNAYGEMLWKRPDNETANDDGYYIPTLHYIANLDVTPTKVYATPVYIYNTSLDSREYEYDSESTAPKLHKESGTDSSANNVIRRAGSSTSTNAELYPLELTDIDENKIYFEKDANGEYYVVYDATSVGNIAVVNDTPLVSLQANTTVMTGIESVSAAGDIDGEAVYYNLQGMPVANPVHGRIYIRCQGGHSEKIAY